MEPRRTRDRRFPYYPSGPRWAVLFQDVEEVASVEAQLGRRSGRHSSFDFDAHAQWFDSDLPPDDSWGVGGAAIYARAVSERLQAQASAGLFNRAFGGDSRTFLFMLAGLRYAF